MTHVLVTGAAGFIGSHTVDRLLAQGCRVTGIDNFRSGHAGNLAAARAHPDFRFVEGDAAEQVPAVLEAGGADAVIHLAALVSVAESVADPEANFRLNVELADRVARAAARRGVKRFVFASSAAVYGVPAELPLTESSTCAPLSPYGGAKLAVEALLRGYGPSFGLQAVCLRYFNVFGPRQDARSEYSGVISRFAAMLSAGQTLTIYGDGGQTRDFVYVGDVAAANAAAATRPGAAGVYNVCTGARITIDELAKELGDCLRRPVQLRYAEPRAGDIRHSCGNPARLRAAGLLDTVTPRLDGLRALVASP